MVESSPALLALSKRILSYIQQNKGLWQFSDRHLSRYLPGLHTGGLRALTAYMEAQGQLGPVATQTYHNGRKAQRTYVLCAPHLIPKADNLVPGIPGFPDEGQVYIAIEQPGLRQGVKIGYTTRPDTTLERHFPEQEHTRAYVLLRASNAAKPGEDIMKAVIASMTGDKGPEWANMPVHLTMSPENFQKTLADLFEEALDSLEAWPLLLRHCPARRQRLIQRLKSQLDTRLF